MPAHRSSDEGEIREAVVDRIRRARPGARIIHEINVSSFGPNRVDVLAVDRNEIIAAEIKSKRDKLDRLPAQVAAMNKIAQISIAALHEKFLMEVVTNVRARHYQRDGIFYRRTIPDEVPRGCLRWVFPVRDRCADPTWGFDDLRKWDLRDAMLNCPLPGDAIHLLWRDELRDLCGAVGIPTTRRSTMSDMVPALRWHCSGRDLTRGICAALRRRDCAEADPMIDEAQA